jgi:cell division protein FtsZ
MPLHSIDFNQLSQVPAVVRRPRAAQVEALAASGMDHLDIPAFLRKQAD